MLQRIALLAIVTPRRVIAVAVLVMLAAGIFGIPVAKSLSSSGFQDALVMSISFAAPLVAHVQFMRMFGLGTTLAVLVDATLVRIVLLPAFMHVLGRWNWWAPKTLVWLHDRIGVREGEKLTARTAMPVA